jgi:hypothetical protein
MGRICSGASNQSGPTIGEDRQCSLLASKYKREEFICPAFLQPVLHERLIIQQGL